MQATATTTRTQAQAQARQIQRLEARLLQRLSRRKFATRSGIHVSAVARILRGERGLSMASAKKWARAVGTTVDGVLTTLEELRKTTKAAKVVARRRRR